MTGIDTNVLVRMLAADDESQSRSARHFFESLSSGHQGYVSLVVIVELFWVLASRYRVGRKELADAIEGLLEVEQLAFQDSPAIHEALRAYRDGADFADALIDILARGAGCEKTVTFDRRAADTLAMELLP
jgi:predicted nucleic-acid-binding protein